MNSGFLRAKLINNHSGIAEYQTKLVVLVLMRRNSHYLDGFDILLLNQINNFNFENQIGIRRDHLVPVFAIGQLKG